MHKLLSEFSQSEHTCVTSTWIKKQDSPGTPEDDLAPHSEEPLKQHNCQLCLQRKWLLAACGRSPLTHRNKSYTALELVNCGWSLATHYRELFPRTFDKVIKPVQNCHILLLTPTLEPCGQSRAQGLFVIFPFPVLPLSAVCTSFCISWHIIIAWICP